ncbi:MAG: hypothetical protein BGN98_10420 [Microbacterium sp. 69-7]|uniref:hypothetical protein n=1 Tax=Microbacterium sp. 69-7 TaxID=1895784 RepID=UPI0009633630|nr:hypothetical protein [Microbacterium sp. 69-7]OJU43621.1 MAG: hypothetical protein BGN98_10420 [Microbacterium sp. 69-7]
MSLGWPYDARTAAMQAEFVRLEEQFSQEWVVAMRQLAGERLPQEEFTARRMLLLKEDLKRRRREFAKLRWKFDATGKRRPDLVERDIRRVEKWARGIIDEYAQQGTERREAEKQERDRKAAIREQNRRARQEHTTLEDLRVDLAATILDVPTPAPVEPEKPVVRSLEGVRPSRVEMVSNDTGIADLSTATDDDIITAYMTRTGISEENARQYLTLLQPES